MGPGELIGLLARYHVGASSDPRENRLTAVFAALLSASPATGRGLARAWFGDERLESPDVRIQRPVGGNVGWVDLELVVRDPKHHILWIEAKLGAGESGVGQVDKYRDRLAHLGSRATRRRVLLLVPAQRAHEFPNYERLPDDGKGPDGVPYVVTWQDAYRLVELAGSQERRPQINWLRKEVLAYMTTEGLRRSALKPRHFSALTNIDEARAAVAEIAKLAINHLEAEWPPENGEPTIDASYWEQVHSSRPSLDGPQLAWGLDGAEVFAGIYLPLDAGGAAIDEEWRSRLLTTFDPANEAWQQDISSRTVHWIGRSVPLKGLLMTETIERNGKELADYVSATFEAIMDCRS